MNIYAGLFPLIYDTYWPSFSSSAAPMISNFYSHTTPGKEFQPVLDFCCGTGDLAIHFAGKGFTVTGVDISPDMLVLAREKAAGYLAEGQVQFIESDVAAFQTDARFGLVVSTYDSFNHLPTMEHVKNALKCATSALADGGWLIFDMNTERGLRQFNNIHLMDQRDVMVISRSVYDASHACSILEVTGFLKTETGLYERFDQSLINFVYNLQEIHAYLKQLGYTNLRFTHAHDLHKPITNPEAEERIFFVAQKPG